MKLFLLLLAVSGLLALPAASDSVERPPEHRMAAHVNFLTGHPARNPDGSVNAVIEIPGGSTAKWEMSEDGSEIAWEYRDGRPRIVEYLGYPGSYGSIPRTLQAADEGGDGDPLDVLVLGESIPRGEVVAVILIGVLRLLDDGEQDDKLVAVRPGTPLAKAGDLPELDRRFPGARRIVETWFANYKGPGEIEILGWEDAGAARSVLDSASQAYESRAGDDS